MSNIIMNNIIPIENHLSINNRKVTSRAELEAAIPINTAVIAGGRDDVYRDRQGFINAACSALSGACDNWTTFTAAQWAREVAADKELSSRP